MHDTQKNRVKLRKRHISISEEGNAQRKSKQTKSSNSKSVRYRTAKQFLIFKKFPVKVGLKGSKTGKYHKIKIPKNFSFSINPEETILTLRKVSSSMLRYNPYKIIIDFKYCKVMDLAACCILSSILIEASNHLEKYQISILAQGIDLTNEVGQMVVISGLIKHLDFEGRGEIEEEIEKTKILMPLLTDKDVDQPADEIIRYLKKCFTAEGLTLSPQGGQVLGDIVGEIFSNISDHNKDYKKWYAIGHASPIAKRTIVHLAIMNYGVSFYESFFQQEDTENFAKEQINTLFGKQKEKYRSLNKELYVTLLCLQKNISRKRKDKKSTRGQGLVQFLHNLIKIGEYNVQDQLSIMSITTGNVSVVFTGKEIIDDQGRVYLGKDFTYLKDKEKYFKELKNGFPGTVISMEFALNREYLEGAIVKNETD